MNSIKSTTFLALIVVLSCSGFYCVHSSYRAPEHLPNIGDSMPCVYGDDDWLISAAQTAPYCTTTFSGIKFFFATTDRKTVSYISTYDSVFQTPEGIHVGSTEKDVRSTQASDIIAEPGWAYYSTLPSGWCVAYGGIPGHDSLGRRTLMQDSVVYVVFKR